MRTMEKLSVTVTQNQARFIEDKVASGEYASDSEVIRDGLRALAARDNAQKRWLRETVAATFDKIESGDGKFHTIDEARNLVASRILGNR